MPAKPNVVTIWEKAKLGAARPKPRIPVRPGEGEGGGWADSQLSLDREEHTPPDTEANMWHSQCFWSPHPCQQRPGLGGISRLGRGTERRWKGLWTELNFVPTKPQYKKNCTDLFQSTSHLNNNCHVFPCVAHSLPWFNFPWRWCHMCSYKCLYSKATGLQKTYRSSFYLGKTPPSWDRTSMRPILCPFRSGWGRGVWKE